MKISPRFFTTVFCEDMPQSGIRYSYLCNKMQKDIRLGIRFGVLKEKS